MTDALTRYALAALLGLVGLSGLYLLVRHLFLPLRALRETLRLSRDASSDPRLPDSRGTLALTIGAAAAGTATGTATAIVLGGPGAVLWVMLGGVASVGLRYIEVSLAWQTRRFVGDGEQMVAGVPLGLRAMSSRLGRPLAAVFVVAGFVAAAGAFGAQPSAEIGSGLGRWLGISPLFVSGGLAALALGLSLGLSHGATRVARRVTPVALGCLAVGIVATCVTAFDRLPSALGRILEQAFEGGAPSVGFLGAFLGETIRQGLSRGLVTGSSLGIAATCHGGSGAWNAERAGRIAALEPLVSTVLLPLLIGLAVVSSRAWNSQHDDVRIPLSEVRAFLREPASAAELESEAMVLSGIIRVREGQSFDRFYLAAHTQLINEPRFEIGDRLWDGAIKFEHGRVVELLESHRQRVLPRTARIRPTLETVDVEKADRIIVLGEGPLFGQPLLAASFDTVPALRLGILARLGTGLLALTAFLALLWFAESLGTSVWPGAARLTRALVALSIALGPLMPPRLLHTVALVALVALAIPYTLALLSHAGPPEPASTQKRRRT